MQSLLTDEDEYTDIFNISEEAQTSEDCFWSVPVGLKKPNSFGLYDVLGNEAEMTISSVQCNGNNHYMGICTDYALYLDEGMVNQVAKGGHRNESQLSSYNYTSRGMSGRSSIGEIFGGLRPVRTLPEGSDGHKAVTVYTEETKKDDTLNSPYQCETATQENYSTPVLSFVNPWPGPTYTKPLAIMQGRLWFGTAAGLQMWPSSLPGLDYSTNINLQASTAIEAWGT